MAGVVDVPWQPCPHLPPDEMAALIASVSSVTPSPLAPKSFTFRKTEYPAGAKGAMPWCAMLCCQYGSDGAAVPEPSGALHVEPRAATETAPRSEVRSGSAAVKSMISGSEEEQYEAKATFRCC